MYFDVWIAVFLWLFVKYPSENIFLVNPTLMWKQISLRHIELNKYNMYLLVKYTLCFIYNFWKKYVYIYIYIYSYFFFKS